MDLHFPNINEAAVCIDIGMYILNPSLPKQKEVAGNMVLFESIIMAGEIMKPLYQLSIWKPENKTRFVTFTLKDTKFFVVVVD